MPENKIRHETCLNTWDSRAIVLEVNKEDTKYRNTHTQKQIQSSPREADS